MEILTGHDLDGDGTNDFYVGHKMPNDPTGFTGLFMLLFIGLFLASFFIFNSFDDKEGSHLMRIGMFSILGSAVVAGLAAGWLTGLLRVHPLAPPAAFVLFVVIGFVMTGVDVAESHRTEQAKRNADARESAHWNAIGSRQSVVRARAQGFVEKGKATLAQRGWRIKDFWGNVGGEKTPIEFKDASQVKDNCITLYIQADPPSASDVTIEIRLHLDTRRSLIQAYGLDKGNIITQAYDDVEVKQDYIERVKVEGYQWHALRDMPDMRRFRSGPLKQLCQEMETALLSPVMQLEKSEKTEADRLAAIQATKPKAEEPKGRSRWGFVAVIAAVPIGLTGGYLVWRSRRARSAATTSGPGTDGKPVGDRYRFRCSSCQAVYKVKAEVLGSSFRCKNCKVLCTVPMDTEQLTSG
jgi:hypothetical protein